MKNIIKIIIKQNFIKIGKFILKLKRLKINRQKLSEIG